MVLTQATLERPFDISVTFWDRLCGELCLAVAHARELDRVATEARFQLVSR